MCSYEPEDDFYGMEGCCLTCEWAEEGCLCYDCKCRRCVHYVRDIEDWEWAPYEDARFGHCNLTEPPEGSVEFKLARGLIEARINPYIEDERFKRIVAILKENLFRYNPDTKSWVRKIWNERSIPPLIAEIEKLGVRTRKREE
jgi:hypothetical protein